MTFWDFMNEHWFVGPATVSFVVFWTGIVAVDVSTNIAIAFKARRAPQPSSEEDSK